MVESINTKVDLVERGISFHGLDSYGKIMVGDKGFEFYNDRNVRDNIQIPWEEIDYIAASVMFKGKKIPRFAIVTKNNGTYSFSAGDAKKVLRAVNQYIPSDKLLRSLSLFETIKKRFSKKKKK